MATQLQFDFAQRYPLSPREEQVLRGVIDGKTRQQIALELGVSQWTVKDYLQSIREKMGRPSLTSAAALAVQRGLVRVSEEI